MKLFLGNILKNARRGIAGLLSFAMVASLLTFLSITQAAPAVADTTTPTVDHDRIVLTVANDTDGTHANLTATLLDGLADSSDDLKLYRITTGSPSLQATKSAAASVDFQVSRAATGTDEYYVSLGDVQSNSISVQNTLGAWSVALSTNHATFATDDATPTLSWSTSQPLDGATNYYLYFATADGQIFQTANAGTSGTVAISRFGTEASKTYKAYVAPYNYYAGNISQLTNVQAVSNSIKIYRKAWSLTTTVNKTTFDTAGGMPVITMHTNQPVASSLSAAYALYLYDTTAGSLLYYWSGNDAHADTFTYTLPRYSTGTVHQYETYIGLSTYYPPTSAGQVQDVQATGAQVSVTRVPWSIDLSIDRDGFSTADPTPVFTVATNQPVGTAAANYYAMYIFDQGSGTLVNTFHYNYYSPDAGLSHTITAPRPTTGGTRTYIAYIAKYNTYLSAMSQLEDIQATSQPVSTSRTAWSVDVSVDKTIYSNDDTVAPKIATVINQPIAIQNGSTYAIYVFDQTTHQRIGYTRYNWLSPDGSLTHDYIIPRFFTTWSHTYIVYIAQSNDNLTSETQLQDIQATSATMTVARTPWTLTLDRSSATFSNNDTQMPVINAVANQNVAPSYASYYAGYVVDQTTGNIISTDHYYYPSDGGMDEQFGTRPPSFYEEQYHTYVAYIAKNDWTATKVSDLQEIQATSNTVTLARTPWSVTLTSQLFSSTATQDNIQFTGSYNQSLPGLQYVYGYYLFDTTTGTLLDKFQAGNIYTDRHNHGTLVPVPKNQTHTYLAYIALWDNSVTQVSQLTHVEAVSNALTPGFNVPGPTGPKEVTGGSNPSGTSCQACVNKPVNTFNGEEFENRTDLSVKAIMPFDVTRSYSSTNATQLGAMGYGWSYNYDMHMAVVTAGISSSLADATQVSVVQENGSTVIFNKLPNGTYLVAPRILASLTYNADTDRFTFTRANGYSFIFAGDAGHLVKVTDRNSNTLTLTYAGNKLNRVTSSDGKYIDFTWTSGLITEIVDNVGRTVEYTYDTNSDLTGVSAVSAVNGDGYTYVNHLLKNIIDPNGSTTTTYYTGGRVTRQVRPDGKDYLFDYNVGGSGTTTSVTNPDGTVTRYVYNVGGQLTGETKAYGTADAAATSYVYGPTGQPITVTDAANHSTYMSYDAAGNPLSVTDPNGNTTAMTYNSFNQLLTTTNAANDTASNTYDNDGNLTQATDFEGNVTKYTYDTAGRVRSIKAPVEVAKTNGKKTEIEYDTNGFVDQVTTAAGVETDIVNNALGQPTSKTNGAGKITEYHYDSLHRLSWTKTPNNAITGVTYDTAGRIATTTDPKGRDTTYTYDDFDNVLSEVNYLGTTSYQYDDALRVKQQVDYANHITQYTYDRRGNLKTTTDPNSHETDYTYYLNDALHTVKNPNNHTVSYGYDSAGNLTSTTDARNKTVVAQYDVLNRQTQVTTAAGIITKYTYDNNGALIQTKYNDNSTTKTEYDANGKPDKTTDQAGHDKTYTYDEDGNLLDYTDEANKSTAYRYNTAGQLDRVTRPDSTKEYYSYTNMGQLYQTSFDNFATVDTAYVYNNVGQVTDETKNGTVTHYGYDGKSNLTYRGPAIVNNNTANGLTYTYNSKNELSGETYPSGVALTYAYDSAENLLSVKKGSQTLAAYTYDPADNVTDIAYGNGTAEYREYDHNEQLTYSEIYNSTDDLYWQNLGIRNSDGLVTSDTAQYGDASSISKTYTYDTLEQLASVTRNSVTSNYSYNATKNLTSSPSSTNTYNPVGQILNAVASTSSKTTYAYDDRGNRTTSTPVDTTNPAQPVAGTATNYTWTADDKLAEVQSPTATLDYTYDATGLMTGRTKSYFDMGTTQQVTSHQDYVWDTLGDIPTLVEDGDNSYIYGIGTTPFAQISKSTGAITYLYGDSKGSVVATADNSGNLGATYEYDVYGNLTHETGDTGHTVTPFGYTGAYQDADTKLYNLRARWYDPAVGAFLSLDPVILQTGEGYTYASANPIGFSDPLGLDSVTNAINGDTDGITSIFSPVSFATAWMFDHSVKYDPYKYSLSHQIRDAFGMETCEDENYHNGTIGGTIGVTLATLPLGGEAVIAQFSKVAKITELLGSIPSKINEFSLALRSKSLVSIYRTVDDIEKADILTEGIFRTGGNSLEGGKWFSDSLKDIAIWQEEFQQKSVFSGKIARDIWDQISVRGNGVERTARWVNEIDLSKIVSVMEIK